MRPIIVLLGIAGLALMGGGCATVTTGTTQPINIDSDPAGAECTLMRGGQPVSAAVTTPAPVTVKRDAQTIHVRCKKEGYEEGLVIMNSRFEAMTMGNVLVGGIVGVLVDSASGANTKYDPYVMVRMTPLSATDAAAAAARPKSGPEPTLAVTAPAVLTPAAPTPVAPTSVAAAAATLPAGPFDGDYRGAFQFDAFVSDGLRWIDLKVSNGQGTGKVTQQSCSSTAGMLTLAIAPSGAVTGDIDVLERGNCATLKGTVVGQVVGDTLKLTVSTTNRPREVTLTRQAGKS